MGRDYFYKPGSFYRLCDRTGFRYRAEATRKQWDQLIVRGQSWEARQPQDFVRGVRDDQTVPEARVRPNYTFIGNSQSTLSATAPYRQNYVSVNAPFAFQPGDRLGIMLDYDMGVVYLTVAELGGGDFSSDFGPDFSTGAGALGSIFIVPSMPAQASAGNWICNFSSPQIQPQNYPGSASGAGGGDG
jgi:hypothetical protein